MADTAKIRSKFGEARYVARLDRWVEPGQEVEVPLDELYDYTCQDGWEPVGKAAKDAHTDAEQAYEKALEDDEQRRITGPEVYDYGEQPEVTREQSAAATATADDTTVKES